MRTLFLPLLLCCLLGAQQLRAQDDIRYELSTIAFTGNNAYSSGVLKNIIYSKETPIWFWKFLNSFTSFGKEPAYFDSLMIGPDLRSLQEFYNANGYFKMSAQASYQADTAAKLITLTYTIAEGPPATLHTLKPVGTAGLYWEHREEVAKFLLPDTTARYSQSQIRGAVDNAILYLENNGYMLARFDSTVIYRDTLHNRADVEVYLSPGLQYRIKDIVIDKKGEGQELVEDELLTDIVGIKPEETYSLEKIRLSQVRLYRTGLFSTVLLGPKVDDTTSGYVPLLISGNIGLLKEFAPEILMNNQQNTFNVGLGSNFTMKNFFGSARKFTLLGSAGIQDIFSANLKNLLKALSLRDSSILGFVEGTAKIEQPYLFNKPVFGTLEGYYKLLKDNRSNKRNFGGKVSFEFELPRYTFINFLTAYYNLEIADEIFYEGNSALEKNDVLSVLGADLKTTKTDDPIFPASGYNLSFLLEEANLVPYLFNKLTGAGYTSTLFYKTSITGAAYMAANAVRSQVLGVKLKVGHLQAYRGDELNIPSTRKFVAGGSNSVRGWRARDLAPSATAVIQGVPVTLYGGSFLLEGSVEYRFRFNNDIGAALFADYGNAFEDYTTFAFNKLAVATGFGLRYYSPFAPFRIDFGFKSFNPSDTRSVFSKAFFKDVFEFHFGIGEAF